MNSKGTSAGAWRFWAWTIKKLVDKRTVRPVNKIDLAIFVIRAMFILFKGGYQQFRRPVLTISDLGTTISYTLRQDPAKSFGLSRKILR